MQARHMLAAVLVAAMWGCSFVVVKVGLDHFPPLLLAALRFAVSALAAAMLPRPSVSWPAMIAIASTLFIGEFGFLFCGMAAGVSPGLASITIQTQAFFTLVLVALLSWTPPTPRQWIGTIIGLGGLAIVASTVQGMVSSMGLALILAAAASWAIGNVLLKRAGKVQMLSLVAWLSLIPPLPLLFLSLIIEGQDSVHHAMMSISVSGVASVLFLAVFGTLIPFWIWGRLLTLYSPQIVSPFSLLVPVFGIFSSWLVFSETISGNKLLGIILIFVGLAVIAANINALSLVNPFLRSKETER